MTRHHRRPPTSRPAAGCSATAASTTSTSSGSSPAVRSHPSSRPAPTRAASFFTEGGDVDTAAALLTLDDDTLVTVTATRYSGGGHDVRLEAIGSEGTIGVGYDDSLAVRSAEAGVDYPRGPQKWSYMERFLPAYQAELAAFTEVVAGGDEPLHRGGRPGCVPGRRGMRDLAGHRSRGRPHRDR